MMDHKCKQMDDVNADDDMGVEKHANTGWILIEREGGTRSMICHINYCPFCGEKLEVK